ncbi:MAG: YraN family protein [Pseudomonas oryzihabitans]|uniref:YraN family protein n=1 Tax=Pseudomonas oryzihabitans TaxID=47885 RepID=UPI00291021A0|nr:YraN family protein [Pseudomonas oryzihabitans]MDU4059010.1 YraN family protein [Pseudomonas oryzihabitans]
MKQAPHLQRGRQAEDRALQFLQTRGLRLLDRNWRWQGGELDLVMLDGDTVVFVEVRARRHTAWGGAAESIDARKRQRLVNSAALFLQSEARWAKLPCRFDVIAIGPGADASPQALEWIKQAFDA